ncbi:hypothetical protein E2C01_093761 [Portunus trituberculatus]|uniref:Uncharacterized protein n=1 Tax=Portunus trituberculatus TaxID=210409 RepID=A0A5B7JQN5_PORTR|nr:hypothetical protein [Portunus trituberculatus]
MHPVVPERNEKMPHAHRGIRNNEGFALKCYHDVRNSALGLPFPAAKGQGGLSLMAGVATVPLTSIKQFTASWTNLDEAQPAVFAQ